MAAVLVQGGGDEGLEGGKTAGGEQGRVRGLWAGGGLGAQRLARRDREDVGGGAEQLGGVLGDEAADLLDVGGRVEDVDLVDHHHDLLAPLADALQEDPLALGERAVGGGHEQHQVGARHEVAGDRLVLAVDGVGARGVDDVDVLEQLEGGGDDVERRLDRRPGDRGAVLDDVDVGGGGGDPLLEDLAPQQSVDEGALAGVELAGDHEEEELVELERRPLEGRLVLARRVEPHQGLLEVAEQPPVLGQQLVLIPIENAPQHGSPRPLET